MSLKLTLLWVQVCLPVQSRDKFHQLCCTDIGSWFHYSLAYCLMWQLAPSFSIKLLYENAGVRSRSRNVACVLCACGELIDGTMLYSLVIHGVHYTGLLQIKMMLQWGLGHSLNIYYYVLHFTSCL